MKCFDSTANRMLINVPPADPAPCQSYALLQLSASRIEWLSFSQESLIHMDISSWYVVEVLPLETYDRRKNEFLMRGARIDVDTLSADNHCCPACKNRRCGLGIDFTLPNGEYHSYELCINCWHLERQVPVYSLVAESIE